MNPMHRIGLINSNLFGEVAQSTVTIDTVYVLYGVAIVAAGVFWLVGVLVFGGRPSSKQPVARTTVHSSDRITPAVP